MIRVTVRQLESQSILTWFRLGFRLPSAMVEKEQYSDKPSDFKVSHM